MWKISFNFARLKILLSDGKITVSLTLVNALSIMK